MKQQRSHITLAVGVKVFIKNQIGKYLVLQRAKPYPNSTSKKWDIPGGRIIPGETTLAALKREVSEETGLLIDDPTTILAVQDIMRVKDKHTVRITYLVSTNKSQKIKLRPDEHESFQWLTLQELQALDYDIYLTPVIEALLQKDRYE